MIHFWVIHLGSPWITLLYILASPLDCAARRSAWLGWVSLLRKSFFRILKCLTHSARANHRMISWNFFLLPRQAAGLPHVFGQTGHCRSSFGALQHSRRREGSLTSHTFLYHISLYQNKKPGSYNSKYQMTWFQNLNALQKFIPRKLPPKPPPNPVGSTCETGRNSMRCTQGSVMKVESSVDWPAVKALGVFNKLRKYIQMGISKNSGTPKWMGL